jgi:polyisoprenoid-binding protein YceI
VTRYRLLPERSRLAIEARSSVHPIRIETTGLEGYVEIALVDGRPDLATPPGGRVEIATERLRTGNVLYDGELARRLDPRRHPRVVGDVANVTVVGAGAYHVRGTLALHGRTQVVEGEARVEKVGDDVIEIAGEMTIDMRDFGFDPPRLLMLRVHPEMRVRGRVVAMPE